MYTLINKCRECIAYTIYRLIAVWFSIRSLCSFLLYDTFHFISSSNNRLWICLILKKQTENRRRNRNMSILPFSTKCTVGTGGGDTYTSLGYAYIYEIFESIASHKCLPIFIAEAFYRLIESIVYLRKQSFKKCSGINCTVKRNKNQTEVKLAPPIARTHTHVQLNLNKGKNWIPAVRNKLLTERGRVSIFGEFSSLFLCCACRLVLSLYCFFLSSFDCLLLVANDENRYLNSFQFTTHHKQIIYLHCWVSLFFSSNFLRKFLR